MKLLIIDTETTGLNPKKDKIIEIGCILYSLTNKSILSQISCLYPSDTNDAFRINNISVDLLKCLSDSIHDVSKQFIKSLMKECNYIIAHNAVFDMSFIEEDGNFKELSQSKKWICTRKEIKWPNMPNYKLSTIADKMGINYIDSHRAINDCHILLKCLEKLNDFSDQIKKFKHA